MDQKDDILKSIDEVHLASLKLANCPSIFIQDPNYQILSLRLLDIGDDDLEDHTLHFLIYGDNFYSVDFNLNMTELSGKYESIYQVILKHFNYTQNILMSHEDNMDLMEDLLLDRNTNRDFIDDWFRLKKDTATIERFLSRSYFVLNEFIICNNSKFGELKIEFKDLSERFNMAIRSAQGKLGKLDNMYHYYDSLRTEKTNKSIYMLSLISGLFLPLNLIVGFFGMNTSSLFFSDSTNGTHKVIIILSAVALLLTLFFPLLNFFDRIILRRIFGQSTYYERLIERTKKQN